MNKEKNSQMGWSSTLDNGSRAIASTYHPQSNGICQPQIRTIKDYLIKVLEERVD